MNPPLLSYEFLFAFLVAGVPLVCLLVFFWILALEWEKADEKFKRWLYNEYGWREGKEE